MIWLYNLNLKKKLSITFVVTRSPEHIRAIVRKRKSRIRDARPPDIQASRDQ